METARFEQLVARLEAKAAQDPNGYKTKVWLLAMVGYAYLFLILAVLLLLLGGLAYAILSGHGNLLFLKLGIPVAALAFVVVKSMWVKIPNPEGTWLERKDAPALFDTLREMEKRLGSARVHEVILNDSFNASVTQVPRLGLFGWHRNFLILGLPLLQALNEEQFKAVLAHELGHLSGKHSRFGAWIYRVRKTWTSMMNELEETGSAGAFLFRRFLRWYAPFLNAYSFTLARANEYEADRCAALLTDKRTAAEALTAVHLYGDYLDHRFWPGIFEQANREPSPVNAFHSLGGALAAGYDPVEGETALRRALHHETSLDDTHPCLRERLEALGETPRLPPSVGRSALQVLFPDEGAPWIRHFNEKWISSVAEAWRTHYNEVSQKRLKLAELTAKSEGEPLSEDECLVRAQLTEAVGDRDEALRQYEAILDENAGHVAASFAAGRILLSRNEESGIRHLERAMSWDEDATGAACKLIMEYWIRQGNKEEAERYWSQGMKWEHKIGLAKEERSAVRTNDTFLPHGLPSVEREDLMRQLLQYESISSACLVRKAVSHFPERPFLVLMVRLKGMSEHAADAYLQNIIDNLRTERHVTIINVNRNPSFKTVMKKHVEGTII